ncbi:MAG: hypothetical protein JOS17DRAFT_754049 [Linnemannia elongata]|nr:MAG: hypothetical protein JOS17DRAFT_754049 [Linnemannia elongata]
MELQSMINLAMSFWSFWTLLFSSTGAYFLRMVDHSCWSKPSMILDAMAFSTDCFLETSPNGDKVVPTSCWKHTTVL